MVGNPWLGAPSLPLGGELWNQKLGESSFISCEDDSECTSFWVHLPVSYFGSSVDAFSCASFFCEAATDCAAFFRKLSLFSEPDLRSGP